MALLFAAVISAPRIEPGRHPAKHSIHFCRMVDNDAASWVWMNAIRNLTPFLTCDKLTAFKCPPLLALLSTSGQANKKVQVPEGSSSHRPGTTHPSPTPWPWQNPKQSTFHDFRPVWEPFLLCPESLITWVLSRFNTVLVHLWGQFQPPNQILREGSLRSNTTAVAVTWASVPRSALHLLFVLQQENRHLWN